VAPARRGGCGCVCVWGGRGQSQLRAAAGTVLTRVACCVHGLGTTARHTAPQALAGGVRGCVWPLPQGCTALPGARAAAAQVGVGGGGWRSRRHKQARCASSATLSLGSLRRRAVGGSSRPHLAPAALPHTHTPQGLVEAAIPGHAARALRGAVCQPQHVHPPGSGGAAPLSHLPPGDLLPLLQVCVCGGVLMWKVGVCCVCCVCDWKQGRRGRLDMQQPHTQPPTLTQCDTVWPVASGRTAQHCVRVGG
jgi:hypothetical protein